MKNIRSKVKSTLDGIKSRLDTAEKKSVNLKNQAIDHSQRCSEEKHTKKKKEHSINEL